MRFSVWRNLVSKPIQTSTLFIIGFCRWFLFSSGRGKVQISTLSIEWQSGHSRKKILSSLKAKTYSMRQHRAAISFSPKGYQFDEIDQKALDIQKIFKINNWRLYITYSSVAFMLVLNIFERSLILHFCSFRNIYVMS